MRRPAQPRPFVWGGGVVFVALLIAIAAVWWRQPPPVAGSALGASASHPLPEPASPRAEAVRAPVAAESAGPTAQPHRATLHVMVTGDDFAGVAGAHVCVWRDAAMNDLLRGRLDVARGWIVTEQDTAADGSARFDLPEGSFILRAAQGTCSVSKLGFTGDLGAGARQEMELFLLSGRELRGVIVDAGGHGVSGAEVSIRGPSDLGNRGILPIDTVSGADGSFSFCGLDGLVYTVRAVAATASSDFTSCDVDRLVASGEPLVVELGGRFLVQGLVCDCAGAPVPGATVRVAYVGEPSPHDRRKSFGKRSGLWHGTDGRTRYAKSDASGGFAIGLVQPGRVQAFCHPDGMPRSAPVTVDLTIDAPAQSVVLTLLRPVTLEGVVVDEAGRGMDGVSVHVWGSDPEGKYAELVTAEDGSFTADGLTAGDLFNVICYPIAGTESVRVLLADFDPASGPARLVLRSDLVRRIECRSLLEAPLDEASLEWVRCDSGAKGPALGVERAGKETWKVGIPSEGGRYRLLATIGSEVFESTVWDPQSPGPVVFDARRADLTVTFVWRTDTAHVARYIARVLPQGVPSKLLPQQNVMRDSTGRATVTWQVTPGDVDIDLQCVTEKAEAVRRHVLVPEQGTEVTVVVPD